MKSTIAVILMAENQYSTVPKTFTLRALTAISTAEKATIHIQPGQAGKPEVHVERHRRHLGADREDDWRSSSASAPESRRADST